LQIIKIIISNLLNKKTFYLKVLKSKIAAEEKEKKRKSKKEN
jgi:hypothetical protein